MLRLLTASPRQTSVFFTFTKWVRVPAVKLLHQEPGNLDKRALFVARSIMAKQSQLFGTMLRLLSVLSRCHCSVVVCRHWNQRQSVWSYYAANGRREFGERAFFVSG